jgi:Fe-S-cluster containining protein
MDKNNDTTQLQKVKDFSTHPSSLIIHQFEWLRQLVKSPLPGERLATCDTCPLCQPSASQELRARSSKLQAKGKQLPLTSNKLSIINHQSSIVLQSSIVNRQSLIEFRPDAKCCTYIPYLSNFLVGRILREPNPAFVLNRQSVLERIRSGVAVTPVGIGRGTEFLTRYETAVDEDDFGRATDLQCPHYVAEGGLCGIWKHRNSVCATWFCKHERGKVGWLFWQYAQEYMSLIEKKLSFWAMRQLNPGEKAIDRMSLPDFKKISVFERELSPRDYADIWGHWYGREVEFFIGCAEAVDTLTWAEIIEIGGKSLEAKGEEVLQIWRRLNTPQLPEVLQLGKFQVVTTDGDNYILETYRKYDLLSLSRTVYEVLPLFDGAHATADILQNLKEKSVPLDETLLRKLIAHEVLVPTELDDLI